LLTGLVLAGKREGAMSDALLAAVTEDAAPVHKLALELAVSEQFARRARNFQDLTKLPPFGRLTAIRYLGNRSWLCRCTCGVEKSVKTCNLTDGRVVSCGCHLLERIRQTKTKHGQSKRGTHHAEYAAWLSMKRRCLLPTVKEYSRYGGRGIRVCSAWLESFVTFLSDMGPRPSPQHSLDRVNNDGNYEPSNCRWATRSEQGRNKRTNVVVEFQGQSACLAEWSDIVHIPAGVLSARLRAGWSIEDALTRPVKRVPSRSVKSEPSVS
jgi:hypothetical protein